MNAPPLRPVSPERSRNMAAVKSKNTAPERAVRRTLAQSGFRYLLHANLPGTPDIWIPSCRAAVFVHGCFWHGHHCPHGARRPRTNAEYWEEKIARNRERDKRARRALEELGIRVLVIWDCALKGKKVISLPRLTAEIDVFLCRSDESYGELP